MKSLLKLDYKIAASYLYPFIKLCIITFKNYTSYYFAEKINHINFESNYKMISLDVENTFFLTLSFFNIKRNYIFLNILTITVTSSVPTLNISVNLWNY